MLNANVSSSSSSKSVNLPGVTLILSLLFFIALSGVAVAQNPLPYVDTVFPESVQIGVDSTITVRGAGFVPASIVYLDTQPLATHFVDSLTLTATIPASLVTDYGEPLVSVISPAPGGGTSVAVAVTLYKSYSIAVKDMVYDPRLRLFYIADGDKLWVLDPTDGPPAALTSEIHPNRLALSDDGQFLYQATSDSLYRRELPSFAAASVAGPLGGNVQDLKTIPGQPHSTVVSLVPSGSPTWNSIKVLDDGVERPVFVSNPAAGAWAGSLAFMSNPGFVFGSDTLTSGQGLYRYAITNSGITVDDTWSTTAPFMGVISSGASEIFGSTGSLVSESSPDPQAYEPVIDGTVTAFGPDGTPDRAYVVVRASSEPTNVFASVDKASLTTMAFIRIPRNADVQNVYGWGDNGVAFRVGSQEVIVMRTSVTGISLATDPAPVPTIASLSPSMTAAGTAGFDLTVDGSGFNASSIVRLNGTNRETMFVSESQLIARIAASDVATAGSAEVTVFTPTPGGGTSASRALSIVALTLTPESLTFPATIIGLGASNQMVTFTNTSSIDLTLTTSTSGPFAVWYNFCTGTIKPGTSCTMFIGYVAQVAGPETGALSVNYGGGAPLMVALGGTGVPKIILGTNALSFPSTLLGNAPGAQRVSVLNRTGTNVTITSSITGSFWISANSCMGTLAPKSACYIFVSYFASAAGEQQGTLTVTSSLGQVETVSLTGTGVGDIVSGTAALTFAPTKVGSGTGAQRVGVLNRTGVNITITPSITGSFRIAANSCAGTVAPNNGCYIFVAYQATAVGQQTGTLTITPSAGSVKTVSLTGTGQ